MSGRPAARTTSCRPSPMAPTCQRERRRHGLAASKASWPENEVSATATATACARLAADTSRQGCIDRGLGGGVVVDWWLGSWPGLLGPGCVPSAPARPGGGGGSPGRTGKRDKTRVRGGAMRADRHGVWGPSARGCRRSMPPPGHPHPPRSVISARFASISTTQPAACLPLLVWMLDRNHTLSTVSNVHGTAKGRSLF